MHQHVSLQLRLVTAQDGAQQGERNPHHSSMSSPWPWLRAPGDPAALSQPRQCQRGHRHSSSTGTMSPCHTAITHSTAHTACSALGTHSPGRAPWAQAQGPWSLQSPTGLSPRPLVPSEPCGSRPKAPGPTDRAEGAAAKARLTTPQHLQCPHPRGLSTHRLLSKDKSHPAGGLWLCCIAAGFHSSVTEGSNLHILPPCP